MADILGHDFSHWQKNINMEKVAANGGKFVMAKAGEVYQGREYRDAYYVQNITNAKAAGLITGAYFFFRPSSPLTAQRRIFKEMWDLAPADLPPIIDIESADGKSASYIKNAFEHFYNDILETWNRKPIVYSRDNCVIPWGLLDFVTDPLYYWKALYRAKFEGVPAMFWQFSETYRIPGIPQNVDANYFRGTLEQLQSLVLNVPLPPTPPEPPAPIQMYDTVAIANTDGLNIRVSPSLKGKVVALKPRGFTFQKSNDPTVMDTEDDIEWQPLIVWASKKYLK